MRIGVGPRPIIAIKPEIKAIRPPNDYIDLLSKNETEFRRYITDIESNPVFKNMVSNGVIRKIGFRGRIPSHVYQEFQDKQFIDFLKRYEISDKVSWESDFFDKKALRNVNELSKKYNVPRGKLIRAIEYCQYLQLSWTGKEKESYTSLISLDDTDRFRDFEDTNTASDPDESITELSEVIERNKISEQDFVEYFLSGNAEPFDIARDLDLDLDIVEEIIELVEKVNIINSMQINIVDRQESSQKNDVKVIAFIKKLQNPPRAEIQINSEEEYSFRYNIKSDWDKFNNDEESLIDKLKMINQRRSLTFRVVQFIFQYQYMYFVGINPCHLKPLCQAEIARETGEHESTISRILRHKYIETEEGNISLKYFCQSKGEIIQRIIQIREVEEIRSNKRQNPYSDAEIADILEKEYGTKVSRRTVTYYRNKVKKTPKFYMRKRMARKNN